MVLEINQFPIVRLILFVVHFLGCFLNVAMTVKNATNTVKDRADEIFCMDEISENGNMGNDVDPILKDEPPPKKSICVKRIRIRTIVASAVLIAIVYGVYALFGFLFWKQEKFCLTSRCRRAEKYLKKSINKYVDPCDNFYEFACGNWEKNHPIPNNMFGVDEGYTIEIQTATRLEAFLIQPDKERDPPVARKAKMFYRSCLNAEGQNTTSDFKKIANILVQEHLPRIFSLDKRDNFSWIGSAVLSKKLINRDLFIEFDIRMDLKDHSMKRISIRKPNNMLQLSTRRFFGRNNKPKEVVDCNGYINEHEGNDEELTEEQATNTVYYKYLRLMARYIYKQSSLTWTVEVENKFTETFVKFLRFSNKVDKLLNDPNEEAYIPRYISIDELQTLTDRISECNHIHSIINWKQFLKSIFEGIVNIDVHVDGQDSTIIVSHLEYMKSIFKLLAETPPQVIEFYMWWQNVQDLIPFTTGKLLDYWNRYRNEIGLERMPRDLFCIRKTKNELGYAIAYFLAKDEAVQKNIIKISEMVDNIKSAFLEEINVLRWLDRETKSRIAKKLRLTNQIIGFPKWVNDSKSLRNLYTDLELREDNFFNNILAVRQANLRMKLENYRITDTAVNDGWIINLLSNTNAFYVNELNTILIPASLFSFPFYQLGIEALNYGKIGSIIGHELTHGFDNTGREYDSDGMISAWWTNRTKIEFETRKKCFIGHYNDYNFTDMSGTLTKIALNGTRTLDENIADNGGVRIAFNAYKNLMKKIGAEKLLYGLRQYTAEQLYFLAFANSWCQRNTVQSLRRSALDNHSPGFARVLAPLINSKEFAETWQCKRGTPMNPKRMKCKIW